MSSSSLHISGLQEASIEEKSALIDELWESVRRSASVEIRKDHILELERRTAAVMEDPALGLTPIEARALLKRRP